MAAPFTNSSSPLDMQGALFMRSYRDTGQQMQQLGKVEVAPSAQNVLLL